MSKEKQEKELKVSRKLFTEWLEQLQQESWQLELLISGFAIFGIYAARPALRALEMSADLSTSGTMGFVVGAFISALGKGWLIFFINLITHVIFRGLWIGAIGLRYVSNEIDYDSLNYSSGFTEYLKKKVGSYDDFIERLEKLCSVIFAYTFLLFLLFFSLVLFGVSIIVFGEVLQLILQDSNPMFPLILLIYVLLGLLVFFDFITLGGFKKIKDTTVSKGYMYLYRFYSTVTLSFLYRPLLYNFIDNKYTVKLFYLSIPYIFIIMFGSSIFNNEAYPYSPSTRQMKEYGLYINDNYYDDLRAEMMQEHQNEERRVHKTLLPVVSLESFKSKGSWNSLFIVIDQEFKQVLDLEKKVLPFKKSDLVISLFGWDNVKDPKLEELVKERGDSIAVLYNQLRAIRKQYRKDKDPNKKHEMSSIQSQIKLFGDKYDRDIDALKKAKVENALDAYMSIVELKLDGRPLQIEKSFFYQHPNFNEEGIKCYFNTDSLSLGFHDLDVEFKYAKGDSIMSDSYIIPFIKENS